MPFTIYENSRVEERINHDLCIMKEMILNRIQGIAALILVGGFGRGEGTIRFINGEPYPQNDYDVVLVIKERIDAAFLKSLAGEIASKVGIWHVDLLPISLRKLSRLPLSMFNYDLKYGGHVFYGDQKILEAIPEMKADDMPIIEAKVLLFNRQLSLLECVYGGFPKREPQGSEQDFLLAQCFRVLHACCDTALISQRKYATSYRDKWKNYQSIADDTLSEYGLIKAAVDYKLWGTSKLSISPVELWFEARRLYLYWQKEIYQRYSRKKWRGWEAMMWYIRTNPKSLLLRLGMILLKHSLQVEERLLLDKLGLCLLLSLENKEGLLNQYWFEQAARSALKVRKHERPEDLNWFSLVKYYSRHRGI
jgi:hypothetical protein